MCVYVPTSLLISIPVVEPGVSLPDSAVCVCPSQPDSTSYPDKQNSKYLHQLTESTPHPSLAIPLSSSLPRSHYIGNRVPFGTQTEIDRDVAPSNIVAPVTKVSILSETESVTQLFITDLQGGTEGLTI